MRSRFQGCQGVDTLRVDQLNLLKMAPGGHVGRFVIWTESAFRRLDKIYGTWKKPSAEKKSFNLPKPQMTNSDINRILKSEEIRHLLRAPQKRVVRRTQKKNPLKNVNAMLRLNPYAAVTRRAAILLNQKRKMKRQLMVAEKKGSIAVTVDRCQHANLLRPLLVGCGARHVEVKRRLIGIPDLPKQVAVVAPKV
ncbi:hypothetical protein HPB51_018836 [Rhipicephalus microplus]|uniref:Large ribosomal subunit protein uL4 C-terminal domain-containing protein n=1 Tax=Rhipicephalus microplus TaxID=6941 RepID=A0A9J6DNY0_RHIMP|nr:hypothetical protein HPB51_018836 [Rhipicephalus microplus]